MFVCWSDLRAVDERDHRNVDTRTLIYGIGKSTRIGDYSPHTSVQIFMMLVRGETGGKNRGDQAVVTGLSPRPGLVVASGRVRVRHQPDAPARASVSPRWRVGLVKTATSPRPRA